MAYKKFFTELQGLVLLVAMLLIGIGLYKGLIVRAAEPFEITGQVVASSGTPVENVEVYATHPGQSVVVYGPTTTATNGNYNLLIEEAGVYDIHFEPPAGGNFNSTSVTNVNVQSNQNINVQLTPTTNTFSGVLKTSANETISGVQVGFNDGNGNPVVRSTTDSNGQFSVSAPAGEYRLVILNSGGAIDGVGLPKGIWSLSTEDANFDLTQDVTENIVMTPVKITVIVKDAAGNTLSGVPVSSSAREATEILIDSTIYSVDGHADDSGVTDESGKTELYAFQGQVLNGSTSNEALCATISGNQVCLNADVALNEDATVVLQQESSIPQVLTISPSADTYIRSGQNDRNLGGDTEMRIRASGKNRALLKFSQTEIENLVGNGTILSAKLRLTITDNRNNWGSAGRTVDIHRLLTDWSEGNGTDNDRGSGSGATWNCSIDINIQNQAKDCSGNTIWEMGEPNNPSVHPWLETPTATQTITNNQTGIIEYDVTSDLTAFLGDIYDNYGWIIKKTNEGQPGRVSFGTKESSYIPELVIIYQP